MVSPIFLFTFATQTKKAKKTMNKYLLNELKRIILIIAVGLPLVASAQYVSQVWSPDNGDGTYTNPVIYADYSDPDVCVGASGED